ncbi:hypothetical protein T10_442 [Trichinella papuae]|uniref:Uncharacterized protein n=1 Tax=Trichinella papuae TaxID=268474 RepID=A0A0V1M8E0_9BILA|nr:hypothetical protein T10_442 [Trichinella papuae]
MQNLHTAQAMLKLNDHLYWEDSNTGVGFYRKVVDFTDVTKRNAQLKFIMQYKSCPRSQQISKDDVRDTCVPNQDYTFFRCTAVVSLGYENDVLMQCRRSSIHCGEADSMMLQVANQIIFDDLRRESYEKRSVTMKIKYQETSCTVGSDNMLIVHDVYSDQCPVQNL